jgi:predicted transcriptional regulator
MRYFSGQRVRSRRLELEMRPEHLAVLIEKSVSSVNMYEQELVVPPLPVALRLADALHCDLADFLVETPQADDAVA